MSTLGKAYRLVRRIASFAKARVLPPPAPPAKVAVPPRGRDKEVEASSDALDYLVREGLGAGAANRVMIFADGPGATYVISFVRPLRHLARSRSLGFAAIDESRFSGLSPAKAAARVAGVFDEIARTVVVASRFGGEGAAAIVEECRRRKVPLVAHFDDNLFAVPESLGKSKFEKYNDPARLGRMRLIGQRASKIYASTPELARQLRVLDFSAPITAGSIYCSFDANIAKAQPGSKPVFGYMGTGGHAGDLETIVPAIRSLLERFPDASFQTFGSIRMPAGLETDFPGRVDAVAPTPDYPSFLEKLAQLGWRCGLAPLTETAFNACKAETKYVEYAMAGIPTVASDVPVYRATAARPDDELARTADDWTRLVSRMLEDEAASHSAAVAARQHLSRTHTIDILARQIGDVLGLPSQPSAV